MTAYFISKTFFLQANIYLPMEPPKTLNAKGNKFIGHRDVKIVGSC